MNSLMLKEDQYHNVNKKWRIMVNYLLIIQLLVENMDIH